MKKFFGTLNKIIDNVLLYGSLIFLAIVAFCVISAKQKGEEAFILGYRPVYVLSGSMEPTMMTHSLCLTKKVDSLDDIEVGDIITFKVYDEYNQANVMITHRIIDITDGHIQTKGDNNDAADSYDLTMENVQSKVIGIWNGFAAVVAFFDSKYGIPCTVGFVIVIILANYAVKAFKAPDEDNEDYIEEIGYEDDDDDEYYEDVEDKEEENFSVEIDDFSQYI